MLLIDQSLQLFRDEFAGAVARRDPAPLVAHARARVEAGADALDVNSGVEGDAHTLLWALTHLRRALPSVSLVLDGPRPATLAVTLELCEREGVHGPLIVNALPVGADPTPEEASARAALLRATARARAGLVISPRLADGDDPKTDAAISRAALDAAVEVRDAGVGEAIYLDALAWPAASDAERARRSLRLLRGWRGVEGVIPLVAVDNVTAGLTGDARRALRRVYSAAAVGAGAEALILPVADRRVLDAVAAARSVGLPPFDAPADWLARVAAAAYEGRALPATPTPPPGLRAAAALLFGEPLGDDDTGES